MQNAEEADLRTKMFWIPSDFDKGFGHGTEQQVI